jgi:hypothetical protein
MKILAVLTAVVIASIGTYLLTRDDPVDSSSKKNVDLYLSKFKYPGSRKRIEKALLKLKPEDRELICKKDGEDKSNIGALSSLAPIIKGSDKKICGYCKKGEHLVKNCPQFAPFKKACSKDSYIAEKLRDNDEKGCCAAGFFLYYRHEDGKISCLFASETRPIPGDNSKVSALLNNFGGKRDDDVESTFQMAARELREELTLHRPQTVPEVEASGGSDLPGTTINKERTLISDNLLEYLKKQRTVKRVLWSGSSKYALYPLDIDIETYEMIKEWMGSDKKEHFTEILGPKFVKESELKKLISEGTLFSKFHSFTIAMIDTIVEQCGSVENFIKYD